MKPVEKLHGLYKNIEEKGLFIAPEEDINFGLQQTKNLRLNGEEKLQIFKESYNSNLLFTFLAGVMKQGTLVYFGPPGAGKTTSAEFVGHFLYGQDVNDIQLATIYGHPEQKESSMIARLDVPSLMDGVEQVIKREFVQSNVRIVDEVNRLPPGKLSILYQLIDRGFVKYLGELITVPEGPTFLTANAADSGNYPIPPPFLDRVDAAVTAVALNPYYIPHLDARGSANLNGDLEDLLKIPNDMKIQSGDLKTIRSEINDVSISSDVLYNLIFFISELNYCDQAGVELARKSKSNALFKKPGQGLCGSCHYKSPGQGANAAKNICSMTENSISPRTYQAALAYTRALAWWRGKKSVSLEDVDAVMPYLLWHKIVPTEHAFEKEIRFENDRIAMVREMFDTSKRNFAVAKEHIDDYDAILNAVARVVYDGDKSVNKKDLQKEILQHIENLQVVDSVAKYPLAMVLAKAFKELK
jgi:MoxR-like ATPase